MRPKWREIWEKRSPRGGKPSLGELIALNGFDSGAGFVSERDWRANARMIAQRMNLENCASVYEVGCGSGALLYALREIKAVEIGGIDYSNNLIRAAKKAIPNGKFATGEAAETLSEPKFDWVISHGVFHYFTLAYAAKVFTKMITKASKGIAILEVPDYALRHASEKMRRGKLGVREYKQKYTGLTHTYFKHTWFAENAAKSNLKCQIYPSFIPNSSQSEFRFNCFVWQNISGLP